MQVLASFRQTCANERYYKILIIETVKRLLKFLFRRVENLMVMFSILIAVSIDHMHANFLTVSDR